MSGQLCLTSIGADRCVILNLVPGWDIDVTNVLLLFEKWSLAAGEPLLSSGPSPPCEPLPRSSADGQIFAPSGSSPLGEPLLSAVPRR